LLVPNLARSGRGEGGKRTVVGQRGTGGVKVSKRKIPSGRGGPKEGDTVHRVARKGVRKGKKNISKTLGGGGKKKNFTHSSAWGTLL